jgi:hypothetical protein
VILSFQLDTCKPIFEATLVYSGRADEKTIAQNLVHVSLSLELLYYRIRRRVSIGWAAGWAQGKLRQQKQLERFKNL